MIKHKITKKQKKINVSVFLIFCVFIPSCYYFISRTPKTPNNLISDIKGADGMTYTSGTVEKVLDGSTLLVRSGDRVETVSLLGLYIPVEMKDKAMKLTKAELQGQVVELYYYEEKYSPQIREYGKIAAYIYIKHILFGGGLLRTGLAVAITAHDLKQNPQTSQYYLSVENKAKEEGAGIWQYVKDKGSITIQDTVSQPTKKVSDVIKSEVPKATETAADELKKGVSSGVSSMKDAINSIAK